MLKVTNVSKRLGAKRVLRDVSLACDGGEVLTVTGDNGAGKSTLLRVLVGLLQPDRGVVTICGHRLGTFGVAARRALGFVPDAMDAFPDLLVGEYVHLVAALKRGAQASDEASRPELAIDGFWHQRLGALSLGQRRRVDLHCALLGSPWLLVLDEPSSGLDTPGIEAVQALIRQRRDQGLGTVIATNDASFERALDGRNLRLEGGLLRAA